MKCFLYVKLICGNDIPIHCKARLFGFSNLYACVLCRISGDIGHFGTSIIPLLSMYML